VIANIYLPYYRVREWLKILRSSPLIEDADHPNYGRDEVAWIQREGRLYTSSPKFLSTFNLQANSNIRERIFNHFNAIYANKKASVNVDVCGSLCATVTVSNLKSEVISNHTYHEKLILQIIFVPQTDKNSLLTYFMIEGKYAAGKNPPGERNFHSMESDYYSDLSSYFQKLVTSLNEIFK
jgi:hypothetical protein